MSDWILGATAVALVAGSVAFMASDSDTLEGFLGPARDFFFPYVPAPPQYDYLPSPIINMPQPQMPKDADLGGGRFPLLPSPPPPTVNPILEKLNPPPPAPPPEPPLPPLPPPPPPPPPPPAPPPFVPVAINSFDVYKQGRNYFIRDGNGNTLRDVGSSGWPGAFSSRQQAEATIATLGTRLSSIAGSPVWFEVWSGYYVGFNGSTRIQARTLEEFLKLYRVGT